MEAVTENHPMWMPKELFTEIYGRVPRLVVDLVIRTDEGTVMTKRAIEPCIGQWHLPGGTVFFGERLVDAARRIAKDEVAVDIEVGKQMGVIEYVSLSEGENKTWSVSIVFEARVIDGELRGGKQGSEVGFFREVPENTIKEQAEFLQTIL